MKAIESLKTQIVVNEIERRKELNPNYSLRAFARDMGVSHTLVSLIVSGKRSLSDEFSRKLVNQTSLRKEEREILMLGLSEATDKGEKNKISLAMFEKISDWSHYAILSLTEVEDFQWQAEWISKRLNITLSRAKQNMNRLLNLGLIVKNNEGRYVQSTMPIIVENKEPTEATQKFNRSLISKAVESLNMVEFDKRDLSSIVFAMDPSFVPYAIERIRSFRRSLSRELENLGAKEEAYALTVQIFPLSKKDNNS